MQADALLGAPGRAQDNQSGRGGDDSARRARDGGRSRTDGDQRRQIDVAITHHAEETTSRARPGTTSVRRADSMIPAAARCVT